MFELCFDLLRLTRFILLELPQRVLAILACCWLGMIVWLNRGRQTSRRITGGQAAATILTSHALSTRVFRSDGWLADSFHPKKDAIVLSPANFDGTDIAALAIAAHETGHVLQADSWFAPYCLLRLLEPAARILLGAAFWLWLIGAAAANRDVLRAAAAALGGYLLNLTLELVCELDASRRGLCELLQHGLIQPADLHIVRRIMRSSLAGYCAALVGSVAAAAILIRPLTPLPLGTLPSGGALPSTSHRANELFRPPSPVSFPTVRQALLSSAAVRQPRQTVKPRLKPGWVQQARDR